MTDFDRRGPSPDIDGIRWVEDRIAPIEAHITLLHGEVIALQTEVDAIKDSMPHKSVYEHRAMHEAYLAMGIALEKKDEANKKLRTEIKNDFLKTVAKTFVAIIVALLILGLQSRFSTMVQQVINASGTHAPGSSTGVTK